MHTVDEEEEDGGEDVHGLAIADGRVAERVRAEHAAQRADADGRLVGRVLRQRAVQVALDLLARAVPTRSDRAAATSPHVFADAAHQLLVVAGLRLHLTVCTYRLFTDYVLCTEYIV